eukprot:65996-Chlamydomonas_euryale.AAC.2
MSQRVPGHCGRHLERTLRGNAPLSCYHSLRKRLSCHRCLRKHLVRYREMYRVPGSFPRLPPDPRLSLPRFPETLDACARESLVISSDFGSPACLPTHPPNPHTSRVGVHYSYYTHTHFCCCVLYLVPGAMRWKTETRGGGAWDG